MVRVVAFAVIAGSALAADFGIDVGSPVAAIATGKKVVIKMKGATFSVRTHGCAGTPKFSGRALGDGWSSELVFAEGSPGAFAVAPNDWRPGAWLAVVTAECSGAKAGVLLPVDASGVYDRPSARFLEHAPVEAEVKAAFEAMKGGK
jgi:hypothetical protein